MRSSFPVTSKKIPTLNIISKSSSFKRRSIVYETSCLSCEERMKSEIEDKYRNRDMEQMQETEKEMKEEMSKIRLYKYIGETGKSSFERGKQHLEDALQ